MDYETCSNCGQYFRSCTCKSKDVDKNFFKQKPRETNTGGKVIDNHMCCERMPNNEQCFFKGSLAETPQSTRWYCSFHYKLRHGLSPEQAIKEMESYDYIRQSDKNYLKQLYLKNDSNAQRCSDEF
ncbi:MAG: hypothetical protein KAS32_11445 [Candidatus Peribacteraceae bacterium]|nr:hypothetical protein [Candidatus Peribacteraceae bacterium]